MRSQKKELPSGSIIFISQQSELTYALELINKNTRKIALLLLPNSRIPHNLSNSIINICFLIRMQSFIGTPKEAALKNLHIRFHQERLPSGTNAVT